jgi:hypothetical protein
MNIEEIYNNYLKSGLSDYYSDETFKNCYGYVPKLRDETFKYCLDYFKDHNKINIVELGTSRSFVDGKYRGCLKTDTKYWEPTNYEKWDWSAGIFTKYMSDILSHKNKSYHLTSVDLSENAITICKTMTSENEKNMSYIVDSSENFLNNCSTQSIDLLYLDTGNMNENTAKLHLREAEIIVKKNLLKNDGLILIDDVRNPHMILKKITDDHYGKSKYAIPYFLKNGYKIIMDEYQVILKKNNQ